MMAELLHPQTGEPEGIKSRSLLQRVVTAVAYAVVVIGAVLLGPLVTGVVFGLMSAFAAAEFYAMERREARLPNELFGVAAAGIMPLSAALWGLPGLSATVTALIAASLVWHTAFRRTRTADTAITLFGAVYTGFLLAYLVLILRTFDAGMSLALLLIVSVWANDVFAYLVGSLIGRHKLAPSISPKKSWEGFAAGSLATIALWGLAPFFPLFGIDVRQGIAVGIACALGAVIGDLAESRMKREAGVKDSGTWLPGHGGFLDRLDSLILVCLVAYWVLWWGGVR
jgi:phosphatidate cytidylyltransferase